jgi:hypothetical protein
MGAKRTGGQSNHDVNGSQWVTRAEFDKVLELLQERGDVIDEIRGELRSTCRDLAEDVRRELQTQFRRIAQMQQEIDALKKLAKNGRP